MRPRLYSSFTEQLVSEPSTNIAKTFSEEKLRLANLLDSESSFRRDSAGLAEVWEKPEISEDVSGVAPFGSPEHGIPKTRVGRLVVQYTTALSQRALALLSLRPWVERSNL
eukprot:6205507-Pleurochrysis_carterae.AAC.1